VVDWLFCVVQEYQAIVDAEWTILYDKLATIHKSGANIVLSKLPIGDIATQYFADRYDLYLTFLKHIPDIEWVHSFGVSVEIELEMDWQKCKKVLNCQILHVIDQWD